MGADAMRAWTIGFAAAGAVIFYFAPNIFDPALPYLSVIGIQEETIKNFLSEYHPKYLKENSNDNVSKVRLFSKGELSKFDGGPNSKGLYLAILGEVFDVSKGAQHYKPGSSYAFFAGRDASRAYITGDFNDEENAEDVSDLDDTSIVGLNDWLSFYREEYKFVGLVIGKYYDKDGKSTSALSKVLEKIEQGQSNKWLEDNEKTVFPPCNSEFSKEIGSRVWCTNKSGGVERSWVGVPRKLHKPSKDARCVCVRDSGPPSDVPDAEKHSDLGDLEHNFLHEYPDCPVKSSSCKVHHP